MEQALQEELKIHKPPPAWRRRPPRIPRAPAKACYTCRRQPCAWASYRDSGFIPPAATRTAARTAKVAWTQSCCRIPGTAGPTDRQTPASAHTHTHTVKYVCAAAESLANSLERYPYTRYTHTHTDIFKLLQTYLQVAQVLCYSHTLATCTLSKEDSISSCFNRGFERLFLSSGKVQPGNLILINSNIKNCLYLIVFFLVLWHSNVIPPPFLPSITSHTV